MTDETEPTWSFVVRRKSNDHAVLNRRDMLTWKGCGPTRADAMTDAIGKAAKYAGVQVRQLRSTGGFAENWAAGEADLADQSGARMPSGEGSHEH